MTIAQKIEESKAVSAEAAIENLSGMVLDEDSAAQIPETVEAVEPEAPADETKPAEAEPEDEEGKAEDGQLFNAEQQAVFDKRVGKEIGKRKDLEAKVAELEKQNQELAAKVDPISVKAAEAIGVPTAYLSKDEAATLAEYDKWRSHRDFCRAYPDGYEGKDGAFTAEEIRKYLDQAMDKLAEVAPDAKRIRQTITSQYAKDAELGRKLREERAKAQSNKKVAEKLPATTAKPAALAPASTQRIPKGMNKERFEKAGKNKEAAISELTHLVSD